MAVWIVDGLEELLVALLTLKFFRKTDCKDGFIWMQKTTNKRGSFVEITKVLNGGGKRNIVAPASENSRGWESFRETIIAALNGEGEQERKKRTPAAEVRKGASFADVVKGSSQTAGSSKLMAQDPAAHQEVREINWKETIVITRRDFHDDWGRILEAIKWQMEENFIINSFQADNALLKCSSEELA